jgi:Secretion system C-terminal sorting domain/PA domain
MKKYITTLFLCVAVVLTAQAQRKDTTVLSVYNNNQRFMLYPMPFGKSKPDKDFTAEMVIALDTINVLETSNRQDTVGRFPKRWITARKCGKLPTNVKDKVALLHLNTACDISTQVLNAQDAGALAVIIIHTTNSTDSVILPKLTGRDRYADENKVKIPCFTVRSVIGAKLTTMLPSLVGIKRPDSVPTIQTMTQLLPTDSTKLLQQGLVKTSSSESAETGTIEDLNVNTNIGKPAFTLSPNPSRNETSLTYQFPKATDVTVEVKTTSGQVVLSKILRGVTIGTLEIQTTNWANGTYFLALQYDKVVKTKKFVVQH